MSFCMNTFRTAVADGKNAAAVRACLMNIKNAKLTPAELEECAAIAVSGSSLNRTAVFERLTLKLNDDISVRALKELPASYTKYYSTFTPRIQSPVIQAAVSGFASKHVETMNFKDLVTIIPAAVTPITSGSSPFAKAAFCRLTYTQWSASRREVNAAVQLLSLSHRHSNNYSHKLAYKVFEAVQQSQNDANLLGDNLLALAVIHRVIPQVVDAAFPMVPKSDATLSVLGKVRGGVESSAALFDAVNHMISQAVKRDLASVPAVLAEIQRVLNRAVWKMTADDRKTLDALALRVEHMGKNLQLSTSQFKSLSDDLVIVPTGDALPGSKTQAAFISSLLSAQGHNIRVLGGSLGLVKDMPITDEFSVYADAAHMLPRLPEAIQKRLAPLVESAKTRLEQRKQDSKTQKSYPRVLIGASVPKKFVKQQLENLEKIQKENKLESFLPRIAPFGEDGSWPKFTEQELKELSIETRVALSCCLRVLENPNDKLVYMKSEAGKEQFDGVTFHVASTFTRHPVTKAFVGRVKGIDLQNLTVEVTGIHTAKKLNIAPFSKPEEVAKLVKELKASQKKTPIIKAAPAAVAADTKKTVSETAKPAAPKTDNKKTKKEPAAAKPSAAGDDGLVSIEVNGVPMKVPAGALKKILG